MLKILVAFKVIDDFDDILPRDWENLGTSDPDTSYSKRILNCFDEAALENALLLRDALTAAGKDVQLTAVSVCPGYSEHLIKNLPAIKFDRVCLLEAEGDLRFDPLATASVIADFARADGGFDLILAGKQAPPANSGIVPFALASMLGMDILSDAIELSLAGESGLRVTHALDEGVCTQTAAFPLVCTMGNTTHSYLRMPTLREKLATKSFVPEKNPAAPSRTSEWTLTDLLREQDDRECVFLAGDSPAGMAAALFDGYLKRHLDENAQEVQP